MNGSQRKPLNHPGAGGPAQPSSGEEAASLQARLAAKDFWNAASQSDSGTAQFMLQLCLTPRANSRSVISETAAVGAVTQRLSAGKPQPQERGRGLLAEYKGEHLVEHEQQTKNIGESWEDKSGGKALFLWAAKKDEHGRDVHHQLQDKLSKS
jgi:hypothetical protein